LIVRSELQEALVKIMVTAELAGKFASERVPELKIECANMPHERLLEEFAFTQATLEIQHISFENLKAALVKAVQGLGLINIVGEQAISKRASETASVAGIASGDSRKESAKCTPKKVKESKQKLLAEGKEEREIAGLLAERYAVTPDYIRKLLKK
jgi:hypothetical protein